MNNIEKYVSLLPDKVVRNVEIVSAKELGQNYMLHIGSKKMPKTGYIPRIGQRQGTQEDRTTPRITVSSCLLGCFIGYGAAVWEAQDASAVISSDDDFTQGYYIHSIPFDYCLKPTNRMVYDSTRSDEHWLVTYDEETKSYSSSVAGKMFITDIGYKVLSDRPADAVMTLMVEISALDGIQFSSKHYLKKGWYRITGPADVNTMSWLKDKDFQVVEISKGEFDAAKKVSAAMLCEDFKKQKPAFMTW